MRKKRKLLRSLISLILATTVIMSNVGSVYANGKSDREYSQDLMKTGVSSVIQCEKFDSQCGSSSIDGELVETEQLTTLHDGIMVMLGEETVINTNDYLGDSVIVNDINTYSKNMYNANAEIVNLSEVIVAEGTIGFGAFIVKLQKLRCERQ